MPLLTILFALIAAWPSAAQPTIAYIIPDIGTPGMNTYVEIVAPVGLFSSFSPSTVQPGLAAPSSIEVEFVNPLDSNRVVVSPANVSWEGRLITCQFFVKPGAALGAVPFRVRVDAQRSNVDTFFIVAPTPFGVKSGGGVIGSNVNGMGRRSKRGAMIVDSLILNGGYYTIDVTDCDPFTAGVQGYLPMIIMSKGPVRFTGGAIIDAGASGKDGGPGGGGGGGLGQVTPPLIPGEKNLPLGSGYTGGRSNPPGIPTIAHGQGTGTASQSLNGVTANSLFTTTPPTFARVLGAGPGHPFDFDGRGGGAAVATGQTGAAAIGTYYGGGGNATRGTGLPPSQVDISGQIVGNRQIVPLHGGSGGMGGVINDSVGGGGGGGLSIHSQLGATVTDARAAGATGADGCNGCGVLSGDAAAGGAGGSIIIGGRLGVGLGTVRLPGGAPGVTQASAPIGSTSGGGGLGRFRHDGRKVSGTLNVTTDVVTWTGPTIDTISYATQPLFKLRGTGRYAAGEQTDIQIYIRGEDAPWNYTAPRIATVRADSTWEADMVLNSADSLFYIFAVQGVPNAERAGLDRYTQIPSLIFSQSAAAIIRYFPSPELTAPRRVVLDTVLCLTKYTDTIVISNTGLGPLQIDGASFVGPNRSHFLVNYPTFPRTLSDRGDLDTIIIQYDNQNAPDGLVRDTLRIRSNDPGAGKDPYDIVVEVFNASRAYLLPGVPGLPPATDFGLVRVGSSVDRGVPITSVNDVVDVTLVIDSITIKPPGAPVEILTPIDSVIGPGETSTINLRYSPTSATPLTGATMCVIFAEPCPHEVCWPLTGRGVVTAVSTSKPSLSMTVPPCGSGPIDDTIEVINEGSDPLELRRLTLTGGSFSFMTPPVPPAVNIPAGESYRVIVRYTPDAALTAVGTLQIETDDPVTPILLRDIAAQRDSVEIEPSTDSISIATVCPGMSVDTTIRLTNRGSTYRGITARLAVGTEFAIATAPPASILPTESGDLVVRFTPTSQNVFLDTLFVTSMPCNEIDTIMLRGALTLSAAVIGPIDFGSGAVGSTVNQPATIDNTASDVGFRVVGARIVPAGSPVRISPSQTFPITVPPRLFGFVQLDFLPTVVGPLPPGIRLELFIDSVCTDTLVSQDIMGIGLPGGLQIDPNPLDFGGLLSCVTGVDTVTVTNLSTDAMQILSVGIEPAAGSFTARMADQSDPTPILSPTESVRIIVSFNPALPPDGPQNATLVVATSSAIFDTVRINVSGVRYSEALTLTGPPFLTVFPGGSDTRSYTLTNSGSAPIAVNDLTPPPPFTIVAITPAPPQLLLPGNRLTIDIRFAPTAEGDYADSIVVDALASCGSINVPIAASSRAPLIADARWGEVAGEPGERIRIPLILTSDMTGLGVTEFFADARFNKTMLLPDGVDLSGTMADGWAVTSTVADTGTFIFSARGTAPLAGVDTLAFMTATVLLGDALTTPIVATSDSRFITGGARLQIDTGRFDLIGYCALGANRLVRVSGAAGIKSVAPNPTGGALAVEFETVEDGATRLTLYDALGRPVATLVDEILAPQPYRADIFLDLPGGVYILEMRTPTQTDRREIVIRR